MLRSGGDPERHALATPAGATAARHSGDDRAPVVRAELVDPIADRRWLAFVESQPAATIFHHPRWMALLQGQYGYAFSAPCLTSDAGAIVNGLPIARVASRLTGTRLVSLPFSDTCEVLGTADRGALNTLGRRIAAEAENQGLGLEIRAAADMIPSAGVTRRFVQHRLALAADPAAVEAGYRSQIRRGATKARRVGLRAERRTDPGALRAFYRLHMATRRRQGIPTQPKRFILRFADLFDRGLGFVMLVGDGAAVMAAAVFLTCNRTVTYKYGASDPRHLGSRPNNLLFIEAVRWACEHSYDVLDFGRTDRSNAGLRSFKSGFGAVETDLSYTYVGRARPSPDASPGGDALAWIIRHGPPALSRLVGEALYRHVG